ncbi:Hypothetical predicted protein [Mytilus galloprovincialis]|nr:Hypothetical predicted protein [Mytilus galloprovincialis]
MININLQQASKVQFHADECFNGTNDKFLKNLMNEFKSKPLQQTNGPLTPSSTYSLVSLNDALYDIDLIGYVYQDNLQSIKDKLKKTWKTVRGDIKDVDILIANSLQMIGKYGTRVTKIQYLASSRGSLITPKSHTPPSTSVINDEFQKCCEKGQQHLATVFIQPLYHYTQGVRVTIDKPAKDIKLDDVKRQLKSNYMSSLKDSNRCSSGCKLDIEVASLEETLDSGKSDAVYFPILNGSLINDNGLSGVHKNIQACDSSCASSRRQYVDIGGRIKLRDIGSVRRALVLNNGAARHTRAVADLNMVKNNYLTSNGYPVTRVWYSEPFNDSKIQWPNPNLAGRLDSIMKELSASNKTIVLNETQKIFEINLDGEVPAGQLNNVNNAIISAWKNFNSDLQSSDLGLTIKSWDKNYFSEKSGHKVTKVKYVVSVLNADSSNTALQEPNQNVTKHKLPKGISTCACIPRKLREIRVTGQIDMIDKNKIQNILKLLWTSENTGLGVNINTKVMNVLKGFQTNDGKPAAKIEYYVSPTLQGGGYVDEDDLDQPSYKNIKLKLQQQVPGLKVVETALVQKPSASEEKESKTWIYVVIGVAVALLLIIILLSLIILYRRLRRIESRTLKQSPGEMNGYDKEHFSEQPDFDSPNYSFSENEVPENEKNGTYMVNS